MNILPILLGIVGSTLLLLVKRTRIDSKGWIHSSLVQKIPSHKSWYGDELDSGIPLGIVAHYTATNAGTGIVMAQKRAKPKPAGHRSASWHITIDRDGSVIQQLPLLWEGWHAAKGKVRGYRPNGSTIGVEMVGHGKSFTEAQIDSAKKVWRAVIQKYGIPRAYAMIEHSKLDPERRSDPGPVWMQNHAEDILDYAYLGN